VRALLRQDPDIIMVGEIRDLETAEMAVQSALTGHLVLSTLHTNDAPTAITRLLELGLPPYLIRSTMLGVMAQRLVRILCPHCKEEGEIDQATWKDLVAPWTVAKPAKIYHPKGCLECRDTGFIGRMGIYEVLPISHEISGLINDNVDHLKLRQQGMKEGMHNLKLSGAQKVAAGLTTVEEVMRVAPMS
jgi:general secretion pathway protein E